MGIEASNEDNLLTAFSRWETAKRHLDLLKQQSSRFNDGINRSLVSEMENHSLQSLDPLKASEMVRHRIKIAESIEIMMREEYLNLMQEYMR